MSPLKVSVIIPTLNEETSVEICIQSARTAQANEIIVADGGSTDDTIRNAVQARVVTSDPGRSCQQNAGADTATGDILLFLHADCQLTEDCVAQVRDAFNDDERLVATCFRQQVDDPSWAYRIVAAGNRLRARTLKWAYGDQGIAVRTSVFRETGGFPDVTFLEDLLIMKRLKRIGRIRVLDAPLLVSARRWKSRGLLRQTLRNLALVSAAHLGISPNRLARFYPNER